MLCERQKFRCSFYRPGPRSSAGKNFLSTLCYDNDTKSKELVKSLYEWERA